MVTPLNVRAEAQRLFPDVPVVGMTFIPTETTRIELARIAPEARVAVVSYFAEFLALMRAGILRFAPHVSATDACLWDAPEIDEVLDRCEVLIFATARKACASACAPARGPSNTATPPIPTRSEPNSCRPSRRGARRPASRKPPLKIDDSNWFEIEAYLKHDDRCVLPLGSTEQHAYLSLSVDSILAGRMAAEAAEPLGVPVFPVLAYGLTPYFNAYPGTVSLRTVTYMAVVRDILDSLYRSGFRRVLIVNGHGGNSPVQPVTMEWMDERPGARARFHNWWNAPRAWAKVQEIDRRRATPPGWRTSPGRACPDAPFPASRSRWPTSTA